MLTLGLVPGFASPENIPFAVALLLLLLIGLTQALAFFVGLGVFDFLDNLLPDFEAPGLDGDLPDVSWVGQFFSWLNLGRVPLIISFMLALGWFAFLGFNIQFALHWVGLPHMPAVLASVLAFAVMLPPLRWSNRLIGKILPKDESMAVSRLTFIGRTATIVIGTASFDRPAEAKLKGPLGRTHYIMVRPDAPDETFQQGDCVLLVAKEGSVFTAIKPENPLLNLTLTPKTPNP